MPTVQELRRCHRDPVRYAGDAGSSSTSCAGGAEFSATRAAQAHHRPAAEAAAGSGAATASASEWSASRGGANGVCLRMGGSSMPRLVQSAACAAYSSAQNAPPRGVVGVRAALVSRTACVTRHGTGTMASLPAHSVTAWRTAGPGSSASDTSGVRRRGHPPGRPAATDPRPCVDRRRSGFSPPTPSVSPPQSTPVAPPGACRRRVEEPPHLHRGRWRRGYASRAAWHPDQYRRTRPRNVARAPDELRQVCRRERRSSPRGSQHGAQPRIHTCGSGSSSARDSSRDLPRRAQSRARRFRS